MRTGWMLFSLVLGLGMAAHGAERDLFEWHEEPLLRLEHVYGAGVHNGTLIVAGANPSPVILVLPAGQNKPQTLPWPAELPHEEHFATASLPSGVVFAGRGALETQNLPCMLLSWTQGRLLTRRLPDLHFPKRSVGAYGLAAAGNTVFAVHSGAFAPPSELFAPPDMFFSLDLGRASNKWSELPIPGALRPFPMNFDTACQGGSVYVFPRPDPFNWSDTNTLGYRYLPATQTWTKVAGPPSKVFGAGGAYGKSQAHILMLDLGPKDRSLYAYHVLTDTWANLGPIPAQVQGGRLVVMGDELLLLGDNTAWHAVPTPRPSALFWQDYAALVIYFIAMAGIGAYFARMQDSTNRFFLGGKRVPWWAVGISIFGTAVSSITYLSIPAKAFATDWVFILASTGTLLMAPLVTRYYLPHYRRWPITTAYEYLERRFNFASRLYGSAVFLSYQIGRVGIVLFLPSICLSAATGIDIYLCIVLMGVFSTLYTVMGGIEAVIWTDVVQSFVLLGGAVLVLIFAAMGVEGGFPTMIDTAWHAGKMHTFTWSWDATIATVWVCIVGNFFATSYPMTADQTIVQRYLTTATEKQAARAVWTNALLSIPTGILFFGLGTALWVYYKQKPDQLDPTLQPDAIMPLFIAQQLPAGISGLVLAAVFAAAMSTLSSSINSVASVLINDYYKRFRRTITERHEFAAARAVSLLFGLFGTGLALLMAHYPIQSLLDLFYWFLNIVGGGLGGLMALGVFTRRANGIGGLVGVITSAIVLYFVQSTSLHYFLFAPVAFLTCFIVGYLASLPFKRVQSYE